MAIDRNRVGGFQNRLIAQVRNRCQSLLPRHSIGMLHIVADAAVPEAQAKRVESVFRAPEDSLVNDSCLGCH